MRLLAMSRSSCRVTIPEQPAIDLLRHTMKTQSKLLKMLTSQVGRKVLTGLTGFFLVVFVIAHLLGNLQLLNNDGGEAFNLYGYTLHSFGLLLYIMEIGLAVTILLHAYVGVSIWWRKRIARKRGYSVYKSKGGESKQSIASRTMIYTGVILLIFTVIHLLHFRFGEDVRTVIDGNSVHDLNYLVEQLFSQIGWVIFYVGVMLLLGFHLRHGIWSALQSLGAIKPRWSKTIYSIAFLLGALVAVGFLILPIIIYLRVS